MTELVRIARRHPDFGGVEALVRLKADRLARSHPRTPTCAVTLE